MRDAELESRVIKVVARIVPAQFRKVPITMESRLISDLGVDSMGVVSIAFEIEKEFNISVDQVEFAKRAPSISTVGDVVVLSKEFVRPGR